MYMFVSAISLYVLCRYNFLFIIVLLSCHNNYWKKLGFCESKITNLHPVLTIVFKNVLRTIEHKSIKIFENIQPQSKN